MRNPPRLSSAGGSLRRGVVVASSIGYLLVTAVAALATPMSGGKSPAFAVWLGGGLIFLVGVVKLANRSSSSSSGVRQMAGSIVLALGVTVVVAFLSLVLMVSIWERLGLGH